MLSDIFTNKWILGGIILLIIVAGGCYFWFEYTTSQYEKEAAETEEFTRQWKKDRQAKQERSTEPETASPKAPAESDTLNAEKQRTNVTRVTDKSSTTQAGNPAQNAETADVRVSPHGFGPFPEVPKDYPVQEVFEAISENPYFSENPNFELMARVRIKLWKQGIQTTGIHSSNGLFYPTIPGTIYIEHERIEFPPGIVGFDRSLSGDPKALQRLGQINWDLPLEQISFPPDITVIDAKEGGINPYHFLNLQKE